MNTSCERPRAALMDLDGVIIDSEGLYTDFWSGIDRIYPTGVADFALVIKGTTLTDILSTYFPREDVQADIKSRLYRYEAEMPFPVYPGVEAFLDSLRAAGIGSAVVTSSDDAKMANLWRRLPWLRDRFDTIVTGSDVTLSKPHPQGYLLAAERLGCRAEDCYVFEDSFQGLEAGCASGARVVALATSNPRPALAGKADAVIDGFEGFTASDMLAI